MCILKKEHCILSDLNLPQAHSLTPSKGRDLYHIIMNQHQNQQQGDEEDLSTRTHGPEMVLNQEVSGVEGRSVADIQKDSDGSSRIVADSQLAVSTVASSTQPAQLKASTRDDEASPSSTADSPTKHSYSVAKPIKGIKPLHFALSDQPEAPSVAERELPPAGLHLQGIDSILKPVGPEAVGQDNITSDDVLHIGDVQASGRQSTAKQVDFYGRPRPKNLVRKWPSMLMYLMSQSVDDEWTQVMQRIQSHPQEIGIAGINGGMNALHAACVRYPPTQVVHAIIRADPSVVVKRNFNGETPLHIASYSASEEVQMLLVQTVPQAAALMDQYGDSPLHFAARAGATYHLLHEFVKAAPEMISTANERGVTPFWLLPRSFLEAEELDEVLDVEGEDYRDDWDSFTLFLRYGFFKESTRPQQVRDEDGMPLPIRREDYSWVVHAAAAIPACPREVLKWLCIMFPEQALRLDENGQTPLLLAVQQKEVFEPSTHWNEIEDGIREFIEPVDGDLQNEDDVLEDSDQQMDVGDANFLHQVLNASQVSSQEEPDNEDATIHQQSVVEILLEWSPKSALQRDSRGRLPLTVALMNGLGWEASISRLIAACPRALESRDPVSGLYNFQLAAMCSPQLDTVYSLVRSLPDLLACEYEPVSAKQERSEQSPVKAATKRKSHTELVVDSKVSALNTVKRFKPQN